MHLHGRQLLIVKTGFVVGVGLAIVGSFARCEAVGQRSVAFSYRRLHVLFCREGWAVNHKRVQRLYRDEGLTRQRKRPKRRRGAAPRTICLLPGAASERWARDVIHDQYPDGTAFRALGFVDLYTRKCVGLIPVVRLRADDVAAILGRLRKARGVPAIILTRQRPRVHVDRHG